jgi:hypothetical protein
MRSCRPPLFRNRQFDPTRHRDVRPHSSRVANLSLKSPSLLPLVSVHKSHLLPHQRFSVFLRNPEGDEGADIGKEGGVLARKGCECQFRDDKGAQEGRDIFAQCALREIHQNDFVVVHGPAEMNSENDCNGKLPDALIFR